MTTNQGITPISAPDIKPNSARTRPNFTPNQQQQASLDKLKTFINSKTQQTTDDTSATVANSNANPNLLNPLTPDSQQSGAQANTQSKAGTRKDAMCHGNWVYPTSTIYQQQVLAAAATDQPNSSFPIYASADYGYYNNEKLTPNCQAMCKSTKVVSKSLPIKWSLTCKMALRQLKVMFCWWMPRKVPNRQTVTHVSLKDSPKGGWLPLPMNWRTKRIAPKQPPKMWRLPACPHKRMVMPNGLIKVDESRVEIDDVMFTTCAPDNPTWQINAKTSISIPTRAAVKPIMPR